MWFTLSVDLLIVELFVRNSIRALGPWLRPERKNVRIGVFSCFCAFWRKSEIANHFCERKERRENYWTDHTPPIPIEVESSSAYILNCFRTTKIRLFSTHHSCFPSSRFTFWHTLQMTSNQVMDLRWNFDKYYLILPLSAGISGIVEACTTHPLDRIKTEMQRLTLVKADSSLKAGVQSIYKTGGLPSFYAGIVPRLVSCALSFLALY